MNTHLNLQNVRSPEQESRMKTAQLKGICPFCPDGLIEIHKEEIIHSNVNWNLTKTAFPYEGTKHHFLIIPKQHLTNLHEVTSEHWATFGELLNYLIEKEKIEGGGMVLRFGDMKKNSSSIQHIHIHIICGDATQDDAPELTEKLKVSIGHKFIK